MLTVTFHNDRTGRLPDEGNYDVVVRVNQETIYTGRVEGHFRPYGWPLLIEKFITEYLERGVQCATARNASASSSPSSGGVLPEISGSANNAGGS